MFSGFFYFGFNVMQFHNVELNERVECHLESRRRA